MEGLDIRHDSNLYLQEYISTLENLPSEIQYHWAEIQKRNEQLEELERHIHSRDNNLSKIHRQVMNSTETKADALKNEPIIIRKIKRDYDRIQVLADEKVQIAEQALKLLDRHLRRLDNDLDKVHDGNETRNESRSPQSMMPTRQASPINTLKLPLAEMIGEGSQRKRRRANSHISSGRSTPSIRTRSRETTPSRGPRRQHAPPRHANDSDSQGESDEPLYCICQQVSYGAMVACDGENCPHEWFHYDCVGLTAPPKGAWYCEHCVAEMQEKKVKKLKRKKD
ncbi:hypothetical protein BC943DRAFT_318514 [Umbelopsis sp. AD052]|nr:hypothetical protein BC943DRAFT_318514 [Umbelopsis sp. AD052]